MAGIRVLSVVGTRPNFMKIAPIAAELARRGDAFEHTLVHTGQHYDAAMSEIFFEQLGVGEPDVRLDVANTMIDTLVAMRPRIEEAGTAAALGLTAGDYLVVTLHRPALVDGPLLADALAALEAVGRVLPVVFPAHPRTTARIAAMGLADAAPHVRVVAPLGYLEFLSLLADAGGALTDSGGIQEETTFLGVPCLTLR